MKFCLCTEQGIHMFFLGFCLSCIFWRRLGGEWKFWKTVVLPWLVQCAVCLLAPWACIVLPLWPFLLDLQPHRVVRTKTSLHGFILPFLYTLLSVQGNWWLFQCSDKLVRLPEQTVSLMDDHVRAPVHRLCVLWRSHSIKTLSEDSTAAHCLLS